MDQRKLITFLLLSMALWLLTLKLFPLPEPPKQDPAVAGAKADGKDNQAEDGPAEDGKNGPPVDTAASPPAGQAAASDQPGPLQIAAGGNTTQYVSIGSLDLDKGYRMLVTLTNSGAAVLRAELSSPRYRSQQSWSGYLGELQLQNVPEGVRVQVVGDGTPASRATPEPLLPGDVIVGLKDSKAETKLTSAAFKAALATTEPGQEFTLQVKRGDGAPQARTVKLTRRPFAVLRPEIENFQMRDVEPPEGFVDQPSLVMSLPTLNGTELDEENGKKLDSLMRKGNWELTAHDQQSATFTMSPVPGLAVIKRYTIVAVPADQRDDVSYPGYNLQLDVEFKNTGNEARSLSYVLDGPTGMPLEGWWFAHKISRSRWFAAAGLRDIVVRFNNNTIRQLDCPGIVAGDYGPIDVVEALAYAGVDGQYFSAVLIPVRKSLNENWFERMEPMIIGPSEERHPTFANATCRLTRSPVELAAGASHTDSYQLFAGPKRPHLLARYMAANDPTYSLEDLVYYGLALFAAVARTMLAILHFFYSIIGNYGIAIIMLTVLVRGAMFPLSYRQTQSMARMQALKPEMDRINELYKTDMQKRSQATQELYRKHQINPLAGCLPVLLQLPIFMGLYRALMVDVELRQSPLFSESIHWCSDLAAPDKLWNWSNVMPGFIQGFLGPYLNILPLVTVGLFLVTQKMSMPAPTNEQAAMQQKMMKYMTVFIGFMFYKVASGLCLYFIASSLWGIAERKLLPKAQTADAAEGGTPGAGLSGKQSGGPRSGPNGKSRSNKPRKARPKK